MRNCIFAIFIVISAIMLSGILCYYYPDDISTINNALSVAAGGDHSCALLRDGEVKCWGSNQYGQLGAKTQKDSYVLVTSMIYKVVAISAGHDHTCAIRSDGKIKCWGYNKYGQLGNGTYEDSYTPVFVNGIDNAVGISAGWMHSCALLSDGKVKCWGNNAYGQLGKGASNNSNIPVDVPDLDNVKKVSAGYKNTCALIADGTVKCWGRDIDELRNELEFEYGISSPTDGITDAIDIAVGGTNTSFHICVLLSKGGVKCFGDGYYGQLGDGRERFSFVPIPVAGVNNAINISAGGYYTCALLSDGNVKCWGSFGYINDENDFPVLEAQNVLSISAGEDHACAALLNGEVTCWGEEDKGELGSWDEFTLP